jgi:eukaryotic-like serine/threonine-protein kinase
MAVVRDALMGARYRADDRLAVGGMGEIWLGEDTVLQRQVVIKVLRDDYATDPGFRARFRAEARHAAILTQPNVTQVFDLVDDEDERPPCIVMEYVAGESLAAILDRDGPLGADRTWSILGQTAAALAAAHHVGIVHRDIKPGNILVCPNGLVKVTDFGIARASDEASATQPGVVLGTAHYVAPERLSGEQATAASDMYALGAVGYQCLTGRPPFQGDIDEVFSAHQSADPPTLPSDVPRGLADLVLALLTRDPADRPDDAHAIARQAERLTRRRALDDMSSAQAASPVEAYPAELTTVAASRPLRPVLRAHPTALALSLLVVAIIAASVLANSLLTTGPSSGREAAAPATPGNDSSSTGKPIAVRSASVVGGSDHPEELHYVTDSSASSAWYTEHYTTAAFGGLKSGLGLRLQISPTDPVKSVVIHFADTGIAAKLYAGNSLSSLRGARALGSTSSAPADWRVTLPSPVKAQTWLIWVSRLSADSGGYRAGVGGVRFLS